MERIPEILISTQAFINSIRTAGGEDGKTTKEEIQERISILKTEVAKTDNAEQKTSIQNEISALQAVVNNYSIFAGIDGTSDEIDAYDLRTLENVAKADGNADNLSQTDLYSLFYIQPTGRQKTEQKTEQIKKIFEKNGINNDKDKEFVPVKSEDNDKKEVHKEKEHASNALKKAEKKLKNANKQDIKKEPSLQEVIENRFLIFREPTGKEKTEAIVEKVEKIFFGQ